MDSSQKNDEVFSAEAMDAIAAFEGILEAVPNDIGALDALVQTYEVVGDVDRVWEYLVRLINALLEHGAADDARALAGRVKQFGEGRPEQAELLRRIGADHEEEIHEPREASPAFSVPSIPRQQTVESEMAFAWHLLETGMLNDEDYASIVQDLTEVSASESDLTISVLHVLEDRTYRGMDKILAFIAKESNTPLISVISFETPGELAALLPKTFMVQNGVLVFDAIDQEPMVAILNPYNSKLKEQLEDTLGKTCHFYLTLPSAFDAWIARFAATENTDK